MKEWERLRNRFKRLAFTTLHEVPFQDIGQLPKDWSPYTDLGDLYKGDNISFKGQEDVKLCMYFGPKGMKFPYHREHQDEAFLILGKVKITTPERGEFILSSGESGIHKAGEPHHWEFLEDSYVLLFWADIDNLK